MVDLCASLGNDSHSLLAIQVRSRVSLRAGGCERSWFVDDSEDGDERLFRGFKHLGNEVVEQYFSHKHRRLLEQHDGATDREPDDERRERKLEGVLDSNGVRRLCSEVLPLERFALPELFRDAVESRR